MKTDLSPDTDVSLLPRADLPVIWDAFKAKAEKVRATAETLTVTSIDQKEEMALARTTRLTLREIRIAVEAKRVELGESHLKEIKKVNGAATAIKDFIQPLEARLLDQETFAERAEAMRIATLADSRLAELKSIRVCLYPSDLGTMKQEEYDGYVARLRQELVEIETANRLRVEAEKRLAEQAIEMRLQEEAFLANVKSLKVAEDARQNAQRAEWAEQDRQRAVEVKAEQDRQQAEQKKMWEANAARVAQDRAAEQELLRQKLAKLDAEKAVRDADLAEQKRIRDEQFAKLEAELASERAAKQAEADVARRLALAPDVEKLRDYYERLRGVKCPVPLATPEARECFEKVVVKFNDMASIINEFCQK